MARGDGTIGKFRNMLAKTNILILDDWGMAPIDDMGLHDLLEMVDDRVNTGSLIITSQLPISAWHDYIGEPTMADAILDRIVHNAHKIPVNGESMRRTKNHCNFFTTVSVRAARIFAAFFISVVGNLNENLWSISMRICTIIS